MYLKETLKVTVIQQCKTVVLGMTSVITLNNFRCCWSFYNSWDWFDVFSYKLDL